jgi:hypothetical protein
MDSTAGAIGLDPVDYPQEKAANMTASAASTGSFSWNTSR